VRVAGVERVAGVARVAGVVRVGHVTRPRLVSCLTALNVYLQDMPIKVQMMTSSLGRSLKSSFY
jgi:hypothetical protein